MYQAMKEADAAYDAKQKSRSGMVGGNGQLFHDAVRIWKNNLRSSNCIGKLKKH